MFESSKRLHSALQSCLRFRWLSCRRLPGFCWSLCPWLASTGLAHATTRLQVAGALCFGSSCLRLLPCAMSGSRSISKGHLMPHNVQHNLHEPTCRFLLSCGVRRRSQLVVVLVISEEVRASLRRTNNTCGLMGLACQNRTARCRHQPMPIGRGGCRVGDALVCCRQRPCCPGLNGTFVLRQK